MPRSQHQKPRLIVVRFTKAQFMALSGAERELLIRVGLGINELLLFQRLWGALYYRDDPRSDHAQAAHAVQMTSLLLVLIGKLFEACENVDRYFLSSPVSREYLPLFNAQQKAAVKELKRQRGSNNFLARIRNEFAFHFHHDDDLSGYIAARTDAHPPLSIYLGDPDGNSLSAFAAEAFLSSLLALTGKTTAVAALRKIQDEAYKALRPYTTFANAVQLVALKKMLGAKPHLEECAIADDEYAAHDEFRLPFFVGLPKRKPA